MLFFSMKIGHTQLGMRLLCCPEVLQAPADIGYLICLPALLQNARQNWWNGCYSCLCPARWSTFHPCTFLIYWSRGLQEIFERRKQKQHGLGRRGGDKKNQAGAISDNCQCDVASILPDVWQICVPTLPLITFLLGLKEVSTTTLLGPKVKLIPYHRENGKTGADRPKWLDRNWQAQKLGEISHEC